MTPPPTEEEIDELLEIIGDGRDLSGDLPALAARIIRHLRSLTEWRPIESAPRGEDFQLAYMNYDHTAKEWGVFCTVANRDKEDDPHLPGFNTESIDGFVSYAEALGWRPIGPLPTLPKTEKR